MRLAIMQPYFLPYAGYFQLMAATEKFVVLDNVNFIKGGYIHRNRIWLGRHAGWFGLPLEHASPNRMISEHRLALNSRQRARLLRMVQHGYAAAPCRDEGLALLEQCLPEGALNLVDALIAGLHVCAKSLGLALDWVRASDLRIDDAVRGQQRVVSICRQLRAKSNVNLPGGRSLYCPGLCLSGLCVGISRSGLVALRSGSQGVRAALVYPGFDHARRATAAIAPYAGGNHRMGVAARAQDQPMSMDVVIFGTADLSSLAWYSLTHDSKFQPVAFTVDANYLRDAIHEGLPVVAFDQLALHFSPAATAVLVPLGNRQINGLRRARYEQAKAQGYRLICYVSSRATTWPDLRVGENCLIYDGTIIQPFVSIGNNVIIRSGVHISHHCTLADHVFVAAGAILGGNVQVGEQAFVGLGAVIRDGVHVAERSFVGAGAVVIADTAADGVYVGNPARRLERSALDVTG